jgi:ATP-dependent DNA ligase
MKPTELCQLAGTYTGKPPSGGMICMAKIDGWRALYLRDWQGKPGLWTRNGHPIEGVGHILWRLAQIERAAGQPLFIDGEFQIGRSLAETKRWCEAGWKHGGEAGQLFAFDAMPLTHWRAGHSPIPLVERLDLLRGAIEGADGDQWDWRPGSRGRDDKLPPVVMLDHSWVFDHRDVMDQAEQVWSDGGEGLVLKAPEAPYWRKRTCDWLKVKHGQAWQKKAA